MNERGKRGVGRVRRCGAGHDAARGTRPVREFGDDDTGRSRAPERERVVDGCDIVRGGQAQQRDTPIKLRLLQKEYFARVIYDYSFSKKAPERLGSS